MDRVSQLLAFATLAATFASACGDDADDNAARQDAAIKDAAIDGGAAGPLDAMPDTAAAPRIDASDTTVPLGDGSQEHADASDLLPVPPGTCATLHGSDELLLSMGPLGRQKELVLATGRLASIASDGAWNLWALEDGRRIGAGQLACIGADCGRVAMRDSLLVLASPSELQFRAPSDGRLLATVQHQAQTFGIATDSSSVWSANATSITAWSAQGAKLVERPGDYSQARVIAAHDALHVARGPAGSDLIEHIVLADGSQTLSRRFSETFSNWFLDAPRFIANTDTEEVVYTDEVEQVGRIQPRLYDTTIQRLREFEVYGVGDYVWTFVKGGLGVEPDLQVFAVGPQAGQPRIPLMYDTTGTYRKWTSKAPPVLSEVAFGGRMIDTYDLEQLKYVNRDLGDADPARFSGFSPELATAADGRGNLAIRDADGVVQYFEGTSDRTVMSCGALKDLQLSADGIWLAAFRSRQVLVGELHSRTVRFTLDFLASRARLSADGRYLAVLGKGAPNSESTLRTYDATNGSLIREWVGDPNDDTPIWFDIAGDRLVSIFQGRAGDGGHLYNFSSSISALATGEEEVRLSLGSLSAGDSNSCSSSVRTTSSLCGASVSADARKLALHTSKETIIYVDGVRSGSVANARVASWLDSERLLVLASSGLIVDATGTTIETIDLPESSAEAVPLSADRLLVRVGGATGSWGIYDRTTGARVSEVTSWTATSTTQDDSPPRAAANAGFVVFRDGEAIKVQALTP